MVISLVLLLSVGYGAEGTPLATVEKFIDTDQAVCITPECTASASYILDHINKTADPCQDFYNFTCGQFFEKVVIPKYKPNINQFTRISSGINNNLKTVLESPIEPADVEPIKLAKTLYHNCMDLDSIEEAGTAYILEIIESMGGWPVLQDDDYDGYWNSPNFSWIDMIPGLKKNGLSFNNLLSLSLKVAHDNSTTNLITIDQPDLGIPREHLIQGFNLSEVQIYYKFMVDIAISFGADEDRAKEDMKDVLLFEIELAKIALPQEERRYLLSLVGPIKTIQEQLYILDWLKYIQNIVEPELQIDSNETISVLCIHYSVRLSELLKRIKPKTIANYAMLKGLSPLAQYLPKKFQDIRSKFVGDYFGLQSDIPQWEQCMTTLTNNVPLILGAIYVRNFFSQNGKEEAQDIVENIIKQFEQTFDNLDWMDDKTKESARKKMNFTKTLIAYPDELVNDSVLVKFYEPLKFAEGTVLQNILDIKKFDLSTELKSLRVPVKRDDWTKRGNSATVNAFYNYVKVMIDFPAGIFQDVFFQLNRPKYLNYGGIGYVFGHEFSHGFDDSGRRIDFDGSANNWWGNETESNFLKKAKCFIDQFGSIEVPNTGLKINGINSQAEAIADNGGVRNAYEAYSQWVEEHEEEKLLPGISFTQRQLFWINYGITGCEKHRLKTLKERVLSSFHPPQRYRINNAVANNENFSKDFGCPVGSPMNPRERCTLW